TENCRATFNASWRAPLDHADAAEAAAVLHTLTRLTSIAERSLREREQQNLGFVLDGVADGVILSSRGSVLLNIAARRILGLAPDDRLELADFNPRDLDGTPYTVVPEGIPGQHALESGESGRFRIRAT